MKNVTKTVAKGLVVVVAISGSIGLVAACSRSYETIGGSWELRHRSTGLIEAGSLITSLQRVTGGGRVLVDDYVSLVKYYGDDCVVYFADREKGFFGVCGNREPVLVLQDSGLWLTRPEGLVREGRVFVRDRTPWRADDLVPIERVKQLATTSSPFRRAWRSNRSRSPGVPVVRNERRLEMEERDENDMTPLMLLVIQNDPDEVKKLISAGAAVNSEDQHGRTALLLAANYGNERVVRTLLGAGANINGAKSATGISPLARAMLNRHESVALLLVESGADINSRTQGGETPLALARALGLDRVVSALLAKGAR